jgi:hypothetical protein
MRLNFRRESNVSRGQRDLRTHILPSGRTEMSFLRRRERVVSSCIDPSDRILLLLVDTKCDLVEVDKSIFQAV